MWARISWLGEEGHLGLCWVGKQGLGLGGVMAYLVFRMLSWALMGRKTSARGVGWDVVKRRGGAIGVMLGFGMAWPPFILFLETESREAQAGPTCFVVDHDPELLISLPLSPECWDCKHAPPYPVYVFLGMLCSASWQTEPWAWVHM